MKMQVRRAVAGFVMFVLMPTAVITAQAASEPGSPVGLWKMIDDRTGNPRSLIRIVERNGTYQGVIEKGLGPDDRDKAVCEKCPGARKGQPLQGMAIVTGLARSGDGVYAGGEILDPDDGSIYRCKITLKESGTKLDVRGYIGVSLFGRTQTWLRVE